MPVRKVPMSYRNTTGILAHSKSQSDTRFESTLERDLLALLEFRPDVKSVEVQPVQIAWNDAQNKLRRYTPDLLVDFQEVTSRPPLLLEVKYREELRESWSEFKPKAIAAAEYATSMGWIFRLATDRQIRTPLLDNAKFLLPYIRRGPVSTDHMRLIDSSLKVVKEATIDTLLRSIFHDDWNRAALMPTLWYLIGTFQIGVDFYKKITMTTKIWSISDDFWSESVLDRYNLLVRCQPPLAKGAH